MSRYNTPRPLTRSAFFYKVSIALIAVALIVYFMPREQRGEYQFELNHPWRHGQLIAAFDFPIYKSEEAVRAEQDSVLRLFKPYYSLNEQTGTEEVENLKKEIKEGRLAGVMTNPANNAYLLKKLGLIYQRGIISIEDLDKLHKDSVKSIMLTENNSALSVNIDRLLTVKEAYAQLVYTDTSHYKTNLLQQCNLQEFLTPNIIYNEEHSTTAKNELLASVPWSSGMVLSGTKIIDRGEIINSKTYDILQSLTKENEKRRETQTERRLTLFGQTLFTLILVGCFFFYLELFRRDYFDRSRTLFLLVGLIVFFSIITSLMVTHNFFNVYVIPYAMLPIIVRIFMDSRTAFMAHIFTIFICSIILRYPFEFLLIQLVSGITAIYSLRELSQRSQLFRAVLQVVLVSMLFYFAYDLIRIEEIDKLDTSIYIYLAINGVLLLLTYPMLFLIEKVFEFTSNVTLVELSNINNPLLRRMSEEAPGTFQHSLQVSNIAAEAARTIGANSQLVRTAALYHDIGKIDNPVFFTENQSGVNPHNALSHTESAQIIINHVTNGLHLADKYNLPAVIKRFIASHHGLSMTKFFYISYKNEHPDEEVDEKPFTYPGPNPSTQEEAILMMTDAVEAASRSLPTYTEESISNLVDKIIDGQVADGVFRHCPITFKDIETVKSLFKEKLKTVYHTRISYPEIKK